MDGGLGDKVKGRGEEAAGKVQEEWGEATDNPEQEAKGEHKQQEGIFDKTKGKIKDSAPAPTSDARVPYRSNSAASGRDKVILRGKRTAESGP